MQRTGRNRGNNFYKMDQESTITNQEELSEDFYTMAQIHQKLLDEFEDDQL